MIIQSIQRATCSIKNLVVLPCLDSKNLDDFHPLISLILFPRTIKMLDITTSNEQQVKYGELVLLG
jgi:hypothetical protein